MGLGDCLAREFLEAKCGCAGVQEKSSHNAADRGKKFKIKGRADICRARGDMQRRPDRQSDGVRIDKADDNSATKSS